MDLSPVPPGSLLVRVPADGAAWIAAVPPLPRGAGTVVSATVSTRELAEVPTDELVARGYRLAGVVPAPLDLVGEAVDLLVPADLRGAHADWWSALVTGAERVFDLDLGPVRVLLGPSLAAHLDAAPVSVR